MAKISSMFRNVCFTSFDVDPPAFDSGKIRYMVYQQERCEETQRLHWQGYIELAKRMRLKALKALLGDTVHFEPRRGTQAEAIRYCTKVESRVSEPQEFGEKRKQGSRGDIEMVKRRLKNRDNFREIMEDCSGYQAMRVAQLLHGIQPLSHAYKKKRVYWVHGPTGMGKTKMAMEACPEGGTYHATTGKWFDGYMGEKYVVIDELRAKNWPYDLMLRILDGYEMRLPVKGGFVIWYPEEIWITAPMSPQAMYAGTLQHHGSIDQLLRRITRVIDVTPEDLNRVTPGAPGYDRSTSHN